MSRNKTQYHQSAAIDRASVTWASGMCSNSSRRSRFILSGFFVVAFSIIALIATTGAQACSHYFDNNVFPVSDEQLLKAPVADFALELKRLGMNAAPPAYSYLLREELVKLELAPLEADIAELSATLGEIEPATKTLILGKYRALRKATQDRLKLRLSEIEQVIKISKLPPFHPEIPDGLPSEFDDYARGAAFYAGADVDEAVEWWERLLLLPKERRKYRSVWAAYMIGRALVDDERPGQREKAVTFFAKARELAAEGFLDPQKLAQASFGWEARAEMNLGHLERAGELYFKFANADSLAVLAQRAFKSDAAGLARLARDPLMAKLMIASMVARGGPFRPDIPDKSVAAFLAALENAGAQNVENADRIAWTAYSRGDVPSARRWLARSKQDSLLARWLNTKLMLRDGKVPEASAELAKLVYAWPVNEEWNGHTEDPLYPQDKIVGELALLTLARGQYIDAMDLLLRQAFFYEAAYIAERVLTADELKAYVNARWPEGTLPEQTSRTGVTGDRYWNRRGIAPALVAQDLRYLLARRLTRLGRYDEAHGYFPLNWRIVFREYVAALNGAKDDTASRDERGESLLTAAKIARKHGMEIMGTELEPDFHSNGGMTGSEGSNVPPARANEYTPAPITRASEDEKKRILAHHPEPDSRYHYRYIAAAQAWEAAQLLPDESDLKALALCSAGNWIGRRDSKAAAKFYRSLVRDCGTTKLGREARELKWFPSLP